MLLLDTGSTPIVRSTAAKQLGTVVKQHPQELHNLLSRVAVHIKSKSWETRVAAGNAIEEICLNTPEFIIKNGVEVADQSQESLLTFNSFDIELVVKNGQVLLSSAGKEFDADFDKTLSVKDRIALQKKQIKEKLGMDGIISLSIFTDVFVIK